MAALRITPAARDWALQHGGVLTLRAMPQHGCCGGHAALPVASTNPPERAQDYDVETIDGITVYRAQALAEGPYTIDLEGFWRWQRLTVEGSISPWRPTGQANPPMDGDDAQNAKD